MAWETSKGRTALFPSRFKTFVKDVANLKRSHSQHREKSVDAVAAAVAVATPEPTWTIENDFTEAPECKSGISVQLSISFDEPLDFSCNRCYNSSADFKPSEKLLRGLLRRIDHGSYELITRKDPNAPTATKTGGKTKTKRFEMTFQISQKGSTWATRTYKSYQRQVVTAEAAKEVVLSTHRLIGLFLRRHDPEFVWKDGPILDELPEGLETSAYRVGGIQPVTCIPRSRFLEDSQTFETIPGFAMEILVTSRTQRHKVSEWHKTIDVESSQTTPLNLAVAEGLLSDVTCALEGTLQSRRRKIEERHRQECGFIGASCQHYEDNATEIKIRITNKLGPQFDHLERSICSKVVVLNKPESKECMDFLDSLEKSVEGARDIADNTIARLNDLDFRIVELRGRGWKLDEPILFTLGPSDSYSRRSVQAILDRIQAGVADTLRGSAGTVRMTAAKRGHFIMDKTLVAREPNTDTSRWTTPSKSKAKVVGRLKRRIEQDIQMICKDTCSLDNLDDDLPVSEDGLGSVLNEPVVSAVAAQIPIPTTPPTKAVQSLDKLGHIDYHSPISNDGQIADISSDRTDPMSPLGSEASLKSVRCQKTGARAFPLIPTRPTSTYGILELFEAGSPKQEIEQAVAANENTETAMGPPEETVLEGNNKTRGESEETLKHNTHDELGQERATENGKAIVEHVPEPDHTEPQDRRESTTTQESHKRRDDPDEISIAPSTPSLVYGGAHSARSSLYAATPKVQGSMTSADVELLMVQATPGVSTDEHIPNETAEIDVHQKFLKFAPIDSPSSRLSRYRPAPSPLQQQDLNTNDANLLSLAKSAEVVGDSKSVTESEHSEEKQGNRPYLNGSTVKLTSSLPEAAVEPPPLPVEVGPDASNLAEPVCQHIPKEHDAAAEQTTLYPTQPIADSRATQPPLFPDGRVVKVAELSSVLGEGVLTSAATNHKTIATPLEPRTPTDHEFPTPSDGFAQTRQEFDFSSPWTVSTPFNEDLHADQSAILDDTVDSNDASRDHTLSGNTNIAPPSSTTLVRPLILRARQRSFGSAGLLGFHHSEQRLIGVGLRRTLVMGSSRIPFFNNTGGDYRLSAQRPASSGRELDLLRRASSSSGTELGLVKENVGGRGGTAVGGMVLMKRSASANMLQDIRLVKEGNEEDVKERRRGRSGSLMFLIAGATLASQMIKPSA